MLRPMRLFVFFLLFSLAGNVMAGGNLIFNSSFELGENGWSGFREAFTEKHLSTDLSPTWAVDDKTAYVGKRSIKMWNPTENSRRIAVDSADILFEAGKKYTVSYYAKASKAGLEFGCYLLSNQRMPRRDAKGNVLADLNFRKCGKDEQTVHKGNKPKLTTEWKRYSFSFTPKKGYTAYILRLNLYCANPKDTDQLNNCAFIDGIQVEEGLMTAYSPKSETEAAVNADDYLYENTSKINGKVKVISYNQDRKLKLPLILFDTYFEKKLQEKTFNFSLKKGVVAEQEFSFSKVPFGMFCIYTGLQPRTTPKGFYAEHEKQPECINFHRLQHGDESYQSAAYFASVDKAPAYTEKGFRMGTTGPLTNRGNWCCYSSLGSNKDIERLIRLSGSNVFRSWDPGVCLWCDISPAKGKFNWASADERISTAERAGVPTMCVVGGSFSSKLKDVPVWAQKRDRSGNPKGVPVKKKLFGGNRNARYFQPQLEDWREYIKAVATRYKGRIKYYELLNESDLYMPVSTYMEYMKAASEEIRKADPNAIILGICSTADKTIDPNADTATALGECIDLGADKYMDHITIHPYAMLDEKQAKERRNHLAFLKKRGVKAGLWNGEAYFVIADWMPHSNYQRNWPPENLARFLAVDMGEGLTGSTPTHYPQSLLSSYLHPFINNHAKYGFARLYPDARFAIHAATAKFLAGASPLYTLKLKAGAAGYVFKNGKRLLSVVWNVHADQKMEMNLTLPKDANVTVYDAMGNNIKQGSGKLDIPLSAKPYYLEWTGCSPEGVRDAMNNAPISCEFPLKIKRAVVLLDGQTNELLMDIQNMSGVVANDNYVTITSDEFTAPVKIKVSGFNHYQTKTFQEAVQLKNSGTTIVDFSAVADFGKKVPVKGNALIKKITNVTGTPQWFDIKKCVSGLVPTEDDLYATFSIRYKSDGKLSLNVKIKDDIQGKPNKQSWNQDCIELFIDKNPLAGSGRIIQYMIPLKAGTNKQRDLVATLTKTADGYDAEIEIVIARSRMIGFDISIDDSDGDKRKTQIAWRGTRENHKDRSALSLLNIIDSMNAQVDVRYKNKAGKWLKYRYNKA